MPQPQASPILQTRLKIATWNVNNIRKRLPLLLDWLHSARPDVVALQELKCSDADFPRAEIEAAGYGAVWVGQRTWNGVALLARDRDPIEIRRSLPGDSKDLQSRYLEAAVAGLVVVSIYLPNGNPRPGPKFDYKMAWFERLRAHADSLQASGHPVVIAGDYNVAPADLDAHSPESWRENALLQPEPREAFRQLLAGGWTDALRECHPQDRLYSFWDYRRNRWPRDSGLRIDHLLISPSLRPRLEAAGVDREMRGREEPSDHAPVWMSLAPPSKRHSHATRRQPGTVAAHD